MTSSCLSAPRLQPSRRASHARACCRIFLKLMRSLSPHCGKRASRDDLINHCGKAISRGRRKERFQLVVGRHRRPPYETPSERQ